MVHGDAARRAAADPARRRAVHRTSTGTAGAVELLTEAARRGRRDGRPRRAGVSSFGISGTNAHVIIEEPPAPDGRASRDRRRRPRSRCPWVVSAGRADGPARPGGPAGRPPAAGTPAAPGRRRRSPWRPARRFEHRAVVVGADRAELLAGAGRPGRRRARRRPWSPAPRRRRAGRVVFVFPGQGSQWAGMAVELLDAARRCSRTGWTSARGPSTPFTDWSLLDVRPRRARRAVLDRVDVVQPVLFAVMVSLPALWRRTACEPAAVVGHSQGEIAAAVRRRRAVAGGRGPGGRAAQPGDRCRRWPAAAGWCRSRRPGRSVARDCSPAGRADLASRRSTARRPPSSPASPTRWTSSLAACEADGVRARRIPVDYASHSAQVEPIRGRAAATSSPTSGRTRRRCRFYSTRHRRVARHRRAGRRVLVPQPARARSGSRTPSDAPARRRVPTSSSRSARTRVLAIGGHARPSTAPTPPAALVGTLRRDDGGLTRFLLSAGRGVRPRASPSTGPPAHGPRRRRSPCRRTPSSASATGCSSRAAAAVDAAGLGLDAPATRCSAPRVTSPTATARAHRPAVGLETHPWLADHAVAGHGAAARHGASSNWRCAPATRSAAAAVEELTLEAPLVLPGDGGVAGAGHRRRAGRARPPARSAVHARPRRRDDGRGPGTPPASLAPPRPATPAPRPTWPPAGAEPSTSATSTTGSPRLGLRVRPGLPGPARPPGGAATRRVRRGGAAPSGADDAGGSGCTRRCSTPPCTPLGRGRRPDAAAPGCRSPGTA